MGEYLYGFSAIGLQDFIFRTNALREIIGASELIKKIDDLGQNLQSFLQENGVNLSKNPKEVILSNAGNFRAIFDNEADLQNVIKYLPKLIAKQSYGLQITQAVVKYDNDYKSANATLESRLKIARNKITFPLDFSHCILKHNPKTALPLVSSDSDKSTLQKLQSFETFNNKHPNVINELSKLSNNKNKIALLYADGNALGAIVRNLDKTEMKDFSHKLDSATKNAFKKACESTKQNLTKNDSFKIREVICGGDDLVVVCNADIALDFAKNFLAHFENLTSELAKNLAKYIPNATNLTACAGIAFFNHKYPIHYALKLAKDLCARAKSDSKAINAKNPPSSLLFHNIQSSAVRSFSAFVENELTLGANQIDSKPVRLDFGAYFLRQINDSTPTIENLLNLVEIFRSQESKKDAPTSRLRQWLSILESNRNLANNELQQIAKIYADFGEQNLTKFKALHKDLRIENLIVQKDSTEKTPIFDIISIISNTQSTQGGAK
ncbi:Cas10/Cmr2 second palm domain-containing protein [Helicobacter sp. 23-1044]